MFSEDQAFALLKRRIYQDRGLDCEQYKENYLKRRFAVRLRATGAGDYMEYLGILRRDPDEYTRLLNELTINVTQFFRDKDVFNRLRSDVLPDLVRAKEKIGSRSLRVWSAGCASGEETYSLTILLAEELGATIDRWNLRIVGSDLDDASLRVAKRGVYSEVELLEGIPLERHFEMAASPEGTRYLVRDELKRRVRFEKINLLEEGERRRYDIVLCRNVLIYFGRQVQVKIIAGLAESILKDGYLVLGKSETLGPEASKMFKPTFPRERIYQLMSATDARKAATRG
ncbi:MAG: protein-glutamate O-methyltransferase CheR [Actinobacteria bacterium]|nr:protein-glutamate O-methyltransferase CheR [Actinomycetota bacterium]MBU1943584.1 protein-glutamate O-methyltransferase CheR [Actinomycetota bacterium]MBU2688918.1 protein-glutamate O-methyltransferase CheR [Actinomycetota bacterium]